MKSAEVKNYTKKMEEETDMTETLKDSNINKNLGNSIGTAQFCSSAI